MRTRSKSYPNNSNAIIPRRQNRRRVPNIVEPEIRTIEEVVPMADRTMEELLQAPTEGYGEAIIIPKILAENFKIKTNLLQLVQTNKFHGFERDNPHTHISNFKRMTSTLKYRDVPNDAIKLMLFPYSLEGAARIWYEKEPPNSILTWDDLVNKFVNQFFPPSKTTHLKNEISRFTQRFEETFGEAWERFKEMLRACGNLLSKTTKEALKIIKNKSKVRYSRSKANVSGVNTNSRESSSKTDDRIDKLADQISNLVEIVNKQVITPATAKAVEKTYVIYGGAHAYYDCIATDSNQLSVCVATGTYNQVSPPNRTSNQMPPPGFAPVQNRYNQNQGQGNNVNRGNNFQNNQASTSGTLPSNIVPNPKGEMKDVTTRSVLAYEGPSIPTNSPLEKVVERDTEETTDKEQHNCQGSTAHIQPPVVPISISKPDVLKTQPKHNIPYPSRLNDQKLRKKAMNQMEKFFQISHDLYFDISFADALLLMPKFASTTKSLLTNKDKLFELAKVPLNENCSAMLLEKLPEKLGDPGKFLIPSDRSITHPKGVAEGVFVKVGKFYFPTDFVVVDFEADPRVPLILGRSFLRTDRALIDVYREEITLRFNVESVTFNHNHTMRYSSTYDDNSVNRIDVIDIACEEFVQDVLDFQYNSKSNNHTLVSNPSFFEETKIGFYFLKDESIPTGIEDSFYDPEGDILYLEKLLNDDPSQLPPMDLKQAEETKAKFSIEEPPKLELKELLSHLEYAFLEETNKLPKLNDATRKDHFSLPFMDQMLERLAENEFYCFLDGFSYYFQISIDLQDQEKTTFTCPYGTFAYRRMPFGLCNAPVFGDSFSSCLSNLDKMLKRYEDINLLLNWEKCHFMCKEGIVLGHKIPKSGIKVDRAKVDVIAKLPHLTTVKGVRSFLGHADCINAFDTLEKKLTEAPILVVPDWNLPFELMCDASDFAIALKYLLSKQDAKPRLLRWILLLQEFDITIRDKKGSENLAAVHLSRLENPYKDVLENKDINENFPLETLGSLSGGRPTGGHHGANLTVKKVEVKALPTNDARVVVKFLKSLFSRFGTPRAIISDCGTHFCNDWFARVMTKYGVTHRLATAYHPQTSGQVEVSNRGLKCILERTVGENRALWSDKLDDALWAFRIAFKTPIGCTPYKLVYEKSCHLPIELEHKAYWALKHANFDLKTAGDHRKLQLNELNELRDQAYENSLIYKERTKNLHDSKIKNRIFNVGDQVLLFNSRLKIFSGKLKTHWSGPFTITQVFSYGTVELSQPDGPNFEVNGHRVKHYFRGDIPSKVIVARNKRNAKLEQETELLKTTFRNKEATIASLTSETKTVLSEKKTLEDKYLEEIVCLKNANQVATGLLQKFQMPTQTLTMLSKRPMIASNDIHKTGLGLSNLWFGRKAQLSQPTLYDGHRLLQPGHALVTVSDSHETLLETEFVPQKELSREHVYWLSASDIASQSSDPPKPVTSFVHTRPVTSEVHIKVWKIKECLTPFEEVIKKHIAPPSDVLYHRSLDKNALETDITQLKDNITSLRIQNDGYKIKIANHTRRYLELSKVSTHSCNTSNKKIAALNVKISKMKPSSSGTKVSGPKTPEKPKVLAPGMYAISSKYITPPRRGDWASPTPRKKHVTF
uniref:Reverse transcriptase domain-containing protein n=1 Tax=Tanacetum cinerariifolium TaxID=118510 RepID=A0A6L2PAP9_TANCI|nr:reverse transcriptase domain-containing protein [Tanacetum cinerariifolium]